MLIDAGKAAKVLNVPKARVYELARREAIPVVKLGAKTVRFHEEALRRFVESGGKRIEADSHSK
jgi:excisionase family DNA binding protein